MVPEPAKFVYEYVLDHNFSPPPGYKGGRVFENNPEVLPPGNYKEYDIFKYTKGVNRGAQRIVVNVDNGIGYYTNAHYEKGSFIRIP